MNIECILRREGGSKVELDGVTYHFKPDADGRHVAEVASKRHASRLLGIPEGYRLYDEDEDEDVTEINAPPSLSEDGETEEPGEAGGTDKVTVTEDMGRDTLAFLWEQKFGKKPHHAKTAKTLVEEINGGAD